MMLANKKASMVFFLVVYGLLMIISTIVVVSGLGISDNSFYDQDSSITNYIDNAKQAHIMKKSFVQNTFSSDYVSSAKEQFISRNIALQYLEISGSSLLLESCVVNNRLVSGFGNVFYHPSDFFDSENNKVPCFEIDSVDEFKSSFLSYAVDQGIIEELSTYFPRDIHELQVEGDRVSIISSRERTTIEGRVQYSNILFEQEIPLDTFVNTLVFLEQQLPTINSGLTPCRDLLDDTRCIEQIQTKLDGSLPSSLGVTMTVEPVMFGDEFYIFEDYILAKVLIKEDQSGDQYRVNVIFTNPSLVAENSLT